MPFKNKIPKKYQPRGFAILYEDRDIIVGNKAQGFLSVAAKWNKEHTVHSALNTYVRKGQARSSKCVYAVHRLDQHTSGVLIFAKTEQAQAFIKNDWKNTVKIYYAVVHGRFAQKSGTISSFLQEDDEYVVHSSQNSGEGKLSTTEYTVVKETQRFSLLKINLLTGRKNQIRVHMADAGHPVVGDDKYGPTFPKSRHLALHAWSVELTHPRSNQRMMFEAPVPEHFEQLVGPGIFNVGSR